MHLPLGFISCLFSPDSPWRDRIYEAKLNFMPDNKHNSDSVKSVRMKMPNLGFTHKKGFLLFFWFNFMELLNSNSVQRKKVAFTTTLMLILLFCVIRERILMSENAVNHVIYGQLEQH